MLTRCDAGARATHTRHVVVAGADAVHGAVARRTAVAAEVGADAARRQRLTALRLQQERLNQLTNALEPSRRPCKSPAAGAMPSDVESAHALTNNT